MKLNVGCGNDPWGDVRLDISKTVPRWLGKKSTANLIADARFLPFRNKRFKELRLYHALEHIEDWEKALGEFRRTIRYGGVLITDTRNALNPAVLVLSSISNRRWVEKGGLTLKARSLRNVRKRMSRHRFKIAKAKGIRFALNALAPYILIVSKAV